MLSLALALAACGGGSTGLQDTSRLEQAVRMQLEQRLMGANPREPAAKAGTHVETVECRRELERRYACHVEFRDGTLGNFQVVVSRDGRTLRFT